MRLRGSRELCLRAWLLIVAAGGTFLPAISISGPPPVKPPLQILSPADGAAVRPGKVLVIGRAAGRGMTRVDIDMNGRSRQSVPVVGGGFSATVTVSTGGNVVRAVSGGSTAKATLAGAEKGAYRYHPGVEKCAGCHAKESRGFAAPPPTDTLCYRCHRRQDQGRLVHGPIGSGDCAACHDPHGSAHKALTRERHETQCVTCHDQQSSEAHLKASRGKACTTCHDPHSSAKTFLRK